MDIFNHYIHNSAAHVLNAVFSHLFGSWNISIEFRFYYFIFYSKVLKWSLYSYHYSQYRIKASETYPRLLLPFVRCTHCWLAISIQNHGTMCKRSIKIVEFLLLVFVSWFLLLFWKMILEDKKYSSKMEWKVLLNSEFFSSNWNLHIFSFSFPLCFWDRASICISG